MADIVSIATAVPEHAHLQKDILHFMQESYGLDAVEKRKLSFLYSQSGIHTRHSVIADYGLDMQHWNFIPKDTNAPYPDINHRMKLYKEKALPLSLKAINTCLEGHINAKFITHLITISCTGMSAPGLDLEIMEAMELPSTIFRTSINFMGCYAAIHGLKLAKMICDSEPTAQVLLVDTELCTIHFQKEYTIDNASSSLLFSDGCAAILVNNNSICKRIELESFFSQVAFKGKQDMAWEISNAGFLMTLSGYIPQLIHADIQPLFKNALIHSKLNKNEIAYWCIHPGGKKIVDTIQQQMQLTDKDTAYSRKVLFEYGNMSSPTILFVLKEIFDNNQDDDKHIFGIAFGPGLTMETFFAKTKS